MSDFDHGSAQALGSLARQEDACALETLADGGLVALVADGMGGAPAGDLASTTVADCARAVFAEDSCPESAFGKILDCARDRLADLEQGDPSLRGLGSTLICTHLAPSRELRWLNVGDSHLYLLRGRMLRHLSRSHNLGAVLAAQGGETQPGEYALEPALYSHILMSVVSAKTPDLVDLHSEPYPLRPGDRLLLASDGVDLLTLDELRDLLAGPGSAQEIAGALIAEIASREAVHQDNATAVVIIV